jgi:hypothetical protein
MSQVRRTTESYIAQAKEIYGDKYDYSLVDYKGVDTKVIIICPIHGEFIKIARAFIDGSSCNKCQSCNKILENQKIFIENAVKIHGDKYDYSKVKYSNCKTKVEIICKIHGSFLQEPNGHLIGHNCPKCGYEIKKVKISKTFKNNRNIEKLKENIVKIHPNITVISIDNESDVVICDCKYHGQFETNLRNAKKHGTELCSKCINRHNYKDKKIKETFKKHYGNKYDYSLCQDIFETHKIHSQSYIEIICPTHGQFRKRLDEHLHGSGCPKCAGVGYSKSAIHWLEYLMKRDGIFIQHYLNHPDKEYKINVNDTVYKADGYCRETNTIYEYDGCIYHGCPKCFSDRDEINFVNNYCMRELHINTLAKRKAILEMGYNLVFIWEHQWKYLNKMAKRIQRFYSRVVSKK